jgi:hypothetical protein
MRLLATYQFYFLVLRIEVSQELVLVSNQMREGGMAVTSVVYESCWILIEKLFFLLTP